MISRITSLPVILNQLFHMKTTFYSWILFWYQYWHYCLKCKCVIWTVNGMPTKSGWAYQSYTKKCCSFVYDLYYPCVCECMDDRYIHIILCEMNLSFTHADFMGMCSCCKWIHGYINTYIQNGIVIAWSHSRWKEYVQHFRVHSAKTCTIDSIVLWLLSLKCHSLMLLLVVC